MLPVGVASGGNGVGVGRLQRQRGGGGIDGTVEVVVRSLRRGERVKRPGVLAVRQGHRALGQSKCQARIAERVLRCRRQQPRQVDERGRRIGSQLHRPLQMPDGIGRLRLTQ